MATGYAERARRESWQRACVRFVSRSASLWVGVQVTCLCLTAAVHAQSHVSTARTHYEDADFEGALAAIAAAWESDDVSADELVELLRLRALVHLGMGDQDAMREDVRALLSVRSDITFDDATPPEIRQTADSLRGEVGMGIAVETTVEATSGGARIDAEVTGDSADLVRRVVVHTRAGGGSFQSDEPPVEVALSSAEELAYHVEVIGPGGAIIAQEGSASDPFLWTSGEGGEEPTEEGGSPWLWVGIGAGAAAVVGIVLVVALSGGHSDITQPSLPMALSY